jgi:hypothetical protein
VQAKKIEFNVTFDDEELCEIVGGETSVTSLNTLVKISKALVGPPAITIMTASFRGLPGPQMPGTGGTCEFSRGCPFD